MASGRATGGQLEERIDLSEETTSQISEAFGLVQTSKSNLPSALSLLASVEKRARVGNDTPSLVKICEATLQLCKDCNDNESLLASIKNLTTRRSQKTMAISACVNKCIPWVIDMSDGSKGYVPLQVVNEEQKVIREKLVVALRDITEGKMFLEAERARLTRALAMIKEQDGDVSGAAEILQGVHAETYGSLSKREKVEFILEQMRLTLAKNDYVRAAIVGNKINRKALLEEGMEDYKIRFFTLMIQYHSHEKDSFELAKDYHSIYLTSTVQQNEDQWKEALQYTVLFLSLSPYSMEQQDLLHRINTDSNIDKLKTCKETIKLFLTKEIIAYPIPHQDELEGLNAFAMGGQASTQHWKDIFRKRVIQHNIRVASIYYQRIRGTRLAQLLGLSGKELEKEISSMVSNGEVYAKIDRPSDIVRFKQEKGAEAVLSDWASDIKTLLNLLDTTSHLIQKEKMTQ
eukprot:CAMPEP_0176478302 /NCGR_PEP_ID=MMETSP0200_2-20121128/1113_1 /TAXON_ID=947934 /ORGANISM="Chaetoceros sp., Strain GSL56" /LENGTH=459 /DNA_ID=CAMNT_0017874229 /DNA_START=84 /DNA_END=1463 /DNA_ORIENTATION=+